MGIADHKCHDGQKQIVCVALRNKHDRVIVQEKLDGSNVGVILLNSEVVAITRAGYRHHTLCTILLMRGSPSRYYPIVVYHYCFHIIKLGE